ncbi:MULTISPECIES: DoxX family membrane protein [Hymenobacter]|uniref:DoxX family membrane protein n=1 Tax=Hymenobacter jejuensis TaxID=2502781 RepID=A0A5B8A3Q0_9BACT|nr:MULTISPECIES: DoxX family membrane protein [Hymenobacter]MBC6989871.1 DoxX family membrane protein [Hymenobacter sp. BT491]QDA61918.1 DoxX family membrane protein [Hymenobacter jejuensis]
MQTDLHLPASSSRVAAPSVTQVLRITYGLVPIVAGLDKFTNLLTDWSAYLAPSVATHLPFSAHTFMMLVGVIEIGAGLLVLFRPRIGAWVVMAWLVLIALNLLISRHYDVAVRDLVMAVGAWSLGRLSNGAPS